MNGSMALPYPRASSPVDTGLTAMSDAWVHAIPTIEIEHAMTHRGEAFLCGGNFTIPGSSSVYLQLKTDGKYVHFRRNLYNVSANNILYSVYESPSVTDGTVQVPSYNLNRASANTSAVIMYNNPTGVSGGTLLTQVYMTGAKDVTTASLAGYEIIFKPSTSYVAKIDNLQATSALFYFQYYWYEI